MSGEVIAAKVMEYHLKKCINMCQSIGIKVVATVRDQGSNNRKCYKNVGITTDKPYWSKENPKIFSFYDSLHLLKLIRNTIYDNGLRYPNGFVT